MLAPVDVAVFNVALRTVGIITFGLLAVGSIVAPRASRLYSLGDNAGLQQLTSYATRLMFWPSLVAIGALVLFGERILALFGSNFVGGYATMLMLASSQLAIGAVGPVWTLLNVTGHQDRCLIVFGVALGAALGLNLILVPLFGIEGAAASYVAVTLLWTVWLRSLVVRVLDIHPTILG